MEARLSILFYGKKTKQDSDKTLSIYLRVTIDGERFEVSTQRYVETTKWWSSAGRVKGNTEDARTINQFLDSLRQKVYDYQKSITQEGKPFTKELLRQKWYSVEERQHTLREVFKYHNDQLKGLIGKDCSKATHRKYCTTVDHIVSFLDWKFNKSDISISNIAYSFISDFEFWLKTVKNCNHNTAMKYISNLRKIINVCLKNGWLIKDPFVGFKMTKKEVVREILTEEELQTLISKDIQNIRISSQKQQEQIELLELNKGQIRVSEYLTQLPPKELLAEKLHYAIQIAKKN